VLVLQEPGIVDLLGAELAVIAAVERHQVVVEQGQGGLRRAGHG
jgi:hypothetical protein